MFARFPNSSCEMRNPFIVLRFALFAVLIYVNVLSIGFAAWNLTELKSLGLDAHPLAPVLGAPTFVVFNSCLLVFLLVGCLACSWLTFQPVDKVRYECVWTGIMSALQLAGAFSVTVNGPPLLCQGVSIIACASSSLTVALTWISCMMLLMYSFSLLTTAITHMTVIPNVWATSIRAIPWFVEPPSSSPRSLESNRVVGEKVRRVSESLEIKRPSSHYPTPIYEQHTKALPPSPLEMPTFPSTPTSPTWPPRKGSAGSFDSVAYGPIGRRTTWTNRVMSGAASLSHKMSIESMRPTWAKRASRSARRGVDLPFTMPRFSLKPPPPVRPLRPLKLKSCWSQSTASPPPVPALPPKARVSATVRAGPVDTSLSPTSTFYIDLERAVVVSVGPVTRPVSYGMFPEDIGDPDQPITRSQPSEWVRADSDTSSLH
ncbi:hypothetical protein C8Q80DRAFT_1120775 [Daedaleopsis nitida]|nr:hypothetical protein C8Q80DRAFT_1120775 [Daedaleopsis nitida]